MAPVVFIGPPATSLRSFESPSADIAQFAENRPEVGPPTWLVRSGLWRGERELFGAGHAQGGAGMPYRRSFER